MTVDMRCKAHFVILVNVLRPVNLEYRVEN